MFTEDPVFDIISKVIFALFSGCTIILIVDCVTLGIVLIYDFIVRCVKNENSYEEREHRNEAEILRQALMLQAEQNRFMRNHLLDSIYADGSWRKSQEKIDWRKEGF